MSRRYKNCYQYTVWTNIFKTLIILWHIIAFKCCRPCQNDYCYCYDLGHWLTVVVSQLIALWSVCIFLPLLNIPRLLLIFAKSSFFKKKFPFVIFQWQEACCSSVLTVNIKFLENLQLRFSCMCVMSCVMLSCTGVTAGNEEFQQAVHRAVPDGHTFKGYPVQLVHRNARRAFNSCLKSADSLSQWKITLFRVLQLCCAVQCSVAVLPKFSTNSISVLTDFS